MTRTKALPRTNEDQEKFASYYELSPQHSIPNMYKQPAGCGCLTIPIGLVILIFVGYILLSLALKGLFN